MDTEPHCVRCKFFLRHLSPEFRHEWRAYSLHRVRCSDVAIRLQYFSGHGGVSRSQVHLCIRGRPEPFRGLPLWRLVQKRRESLD